MIKLSTMQKLFGLSLILSLFTVAVGMYSVSNLSKLSDDICQCALQRDPPCARKSDPPLGVMCKDTKWGFNEGGKRGVA